MYIHNICRKMAILTSFLEICPQKHFRFLYTGICQGKNDPKILLSTGTKGNPCIICFHGEIINFFFMRSNDSLIREKQ